MTIEFFNIKILVISLLTMTSCYSQKTGATRDKAVILNATTNVFQEEFKLTRPVDIAGDHKVVLIFENPVVKVNPDGAYEIYVSLVRSDVAKLESAAPEFANVLDLFSATTPGVERVETDLTPALKRIAPGGKGIRSLYVTILFRGNLMPDGKTPSREAGDVKFNLKLESF